MHDIILSVRGTGGSMMSKVITSDELDEIIRLRESIKSTSWREIGKRTGVERRRAQLAYDRWRQKQSLVQLRQIRRHVTEVEFRLHIDSLIALADALANGINVPTFTSRKNNVDSVLGKILQQDYEEDLRELYFEGARPENNRSEQQIIRRNKLLLKSLKQHTRNKVRWDILDDWKTYWNECIEALADLEKEIPKVLHNCLKKEPKLMEKLRRDGDNLDHVASLADVVLLHMCSIPTKGKHNSGYDIQTSLRKEGGQIIYSAAAITLSLPFPDYLFDDVVRLFNLTVDNISRGDRWKNTELMLSGKETKAREFKEMLEELRLRPVILLTRCELCPA